MTQGNQLVVDFCSDTMAAQESVDGECEIQCRTVLRHCFDLTFRGEDKYFGSKQVQFDGIQKVHGIRLRIIQNFLDGTQPFFQFAFIFASSSFFIFPVCGEPLLGYVVHPLAAYLHFYPLAFIAHQGYVECLIAVGFGVTYPVAQAVGVRFVDFGYGYVYVKALIEFFFGVLGAENDADSQDIVYFFECDMLGLHLVPDGIGGFYPCYQLVADTHLVQLRTDRCREFTEYFFAFCLCLL